MVMNELRGRRGKETVSKREWLGGGVKSRRDRKAEI